MASTPVYSPINSSAGEIRLLVVEPAASPEDGLVGWLQHELLPQEPMFEALSYTWGSPTPTCDMLLNGEPFILRENAAAALRRLRLADEPRTLWVDAVCINQDDLAEKEGQLVLMRSVFEQAERVVVWLGEPTECTPLALKELRSRSGVTGTENSISYTYQMHFLYSSVFRNITNSVVWQCSVDLENELVAGNIRELLSRPWWTRLWIIQEAVVARNLVFMVGLETFDITQLERSLDRIIERGLDVSVFGIIANPRAYSAQDETFRIITRLRDLWRRGKFFISIYELMYEFRHLQCTNERDRVFGFLSLASAGGKNLGIVPDYSAPTSDVFIQATRSVIHSSGSLDMLNCVRQWRGVQSPPRHPGRAFSLRDQSKYHDVAAMVSDGPGTKARHGWARLPDGWERVMPEKPTSAIFKSWSRLKAVAKDKEARYLDHNTNTIHDISPLKGVEPLPRARHVITQRELPPGWVKTWDNLGRADVRYDPVSAHAIAHQPDTPSPSEMDLAANLPSWVPNWSAPTHLDPRPLLSWTDGETPRYWASGHTVAVVIGRDPGHPDSAHAGIVGLQGLLFDTITALSAPWHPNPDDGPPITRRSAPLLETWETLALDTDVFAGRCPYTASGGESSTATTTSSSSRGLASESDGRANALWRTLIADHAGHLADPGTVGRALMELWYNRTGWADRLPALEETGPLGFWKWVDAISAWRLHEDLHQALRDMEGEDFETKGTEDMYGAYLRRISDACAHRRLAVTERGYMGLVPWNAEVGDRVAVLRGGKTPFVLRDRGRTEWEGEGGHELIGEAFVYGIMAGEVMSEAGVEGRMRVIYLI